MVFSTNNEDSENNVESLDEKIRKRRGGKGKPRLDEPRKIILILTRLKDFSLMESNVNYHAGHYKTEIVHFFPSPNFRDVPILLGKLEESGNVTKRPGEKQEISDFFYYRTEKGVKTRDDLLKTKLYGKLEDYLEDHS